MRVHSKAADELVFPLAFRIVSRCHLTWSPQGDSAERLLETFDGRHCDRIDHLLMKLRIPFRRREAVLRQQIWIVQIDWWIHNSTSRIDINYFDVFAYRSNIETPGFRILLPPNRKNDFLKW